MIFRLFVRVMRDILVSRMRPARGATFGSSPSAARRQSSMTQHLPASSLIEGMATTSRKSSRTRPTGGRSPKQGSAKTSSPVLAWIRSLWSPSIRSDRSLDSDQIANAEAPQASALQRELAGIVLLLFAIFLAGALGTEGWRLLGGNTDARSNFGWAGGLLALPLAKFLGWPAAAMLPLAPAAHALRLFGRLGERKDRSWMVFLLGMVVLLPVIFGVAGGGAREAGPLSGIWGDFAAFYLLQFAGAAGAWILMAISLSILMAATLSWNPIRVVVAKRVGTLEDYVPPTPAER